MNHNHCFCFWYHETGLLVTSLILPKKFQNNLDPSGNYQTAILDNNVWRVEASEETLILSENSRIPY